MRPASGRTMRPSNSCEGNDQTRIGVKMPWFPERLLLSRRFVRSSMLGSHCALVTREEFIAFLRDEKRLGASSSTHTVCVHRSERRRQEDIRKPDPFGHKNKNRKTKKQPNNRTSNTTTLHQLYINLQKISNTKITRQL